MGALTLAAFMLGVGSGRQAKAQVAPDKPIVRIAELEIDPGRIEEYKTYLREEIAASVAQEPGVLSLSAVAIAGKPASIACWKSMPAMRPIRRISRHRIS